MLGITDIGGYLLGLLVIVLLPGPNSLYVLSVAARRGVKVGYQAACGVFLGDAVLMTLAAFGVASILTANPVLFTIVQYAGAGYLVFLAIGMLRQAWAMWRRRKEAPIDTQVLDAIDVAEAEAAAKAPDAGGRERPFRRAFVVSVLNPKAILFTFAFFVQFVDPTYQWPALTFLVLGGLLELGSFLYLSTLILVGTKLAAVVRKHKLIGVVGNSAVGAVFVGFAAKLVTSPALH